MFIKVQSQLAKYPVHIALEGINGVGKTSHMKALKAWFEDKGKKVLISRLPGSHEVPVNVEIRGLLDRFGKDLSQMGRFFLYMADFAEHTEKVIRHNTDYDVVLLDRSPLSTLAYQGIMGRIPLNFITDAFDKIPQCMPHTTILLDCHPKVAQQRIVTSAGDKNKTVGGYADKDENWFIELREAYLNMWKMYFNPQHPHPCNRYIVGGKVIDAEHYSQDEVFKKIIEHVEAVHFPSNRSDWNGTTNTGWSVSFPGQEGVILNANDNKAENKNGQAQI